MSEVRSEDAKSFDRKWTQAVVIGVSAVSIVVAYGLTAKGWYDASERDKERGIAYDSVAQSLAAHDIIATQLDIHVQDDTYSFVAYNGRQPYICEGEYEYDGDKVTILFAALECRDAARAEQTEIT